MKFGYLGAEYEIDLAQSEADEFAAVMDKYTSAGRRVGGRAGRSAAPADGGRSKNELASIRAWAKENGYNVSDRGRIAAEVMAAYDKSKA